MSGLILPASATATAPPTQRHRCHLCGFEADAMYLRAFLQHVKRCAGEHEGEMQEAASEQSTSIFTGESPDPERDAHFARGGN